ncbi:hypothetical protein D3C72_2175680 [compost metagenome]
MVAQVQVGEVEDHHGEVDQGQEEDGPVARLVEQPQQPPPERPGHGPQVVVSPREEGAEDLLSERDGQIAGGGRHGDLFGGA